MTEARHHLHNSLPPQQSSLQLPFQRQGSYTQLSQSGSGNLSTQPVHPQHSSLQHPAGPSSQHPGLPPTAPYSIVMPAPHIPQDQFPASLQAWQAGLVTQRPAPTVPVAGLQPPQQTAYSKASQAPAPAHVFWGAGAPMPSSSVQTQPQLQQAGSTSLGKSSDVQVSAWKRFTDMLWLGARVY